MKILSILIILLCMMTHSCDANNIKDPNVSGQFYPDDAKALSEEITSYIQQAPAPENKEHVEALVCPHAGYVYSGSVAAYGYKAASKTPYATIVVIAPSHHFGFDGFSIGTFDGFRTPLGIIDTDRSFAEKLLEMDAKFISKPVAFDKEHSLEVQLPFIQKVFPKAKIVPIIAGQPSWETSQKLAESLDQLIGTREDVLLVLSSDMSHFHSDSKARVIDRHTTEAIENMQIHEFWDQCRRRTMEMCGFVPVTVGMLYAQKRGLKPHILKYATSGDVTWDKSRVVGYLSVMFTKAKASSPYMNDGGGVAPLTVQQKKRLIEIAKKTVEKHVTTGEELDVQESDPRLNEVEGAFVTLHKNGQLRGCIGHIIGRQPLYLTVRDMAIAASSEDPRFRPVKESELGQLDLEISVLSKPRQIYDVEEIKMGVHGVIVKQGFMHQGVFLPQVATETGWNREQFLSNLCAHKAGLSPLAWKDPSTRIEIFTADVFSEKDFE